MTEEWTRVADRASLADGIHPVRVAGRSIIIGVFDDTVTAFSAFCPHMRGPMARSEVEGYVVSCPLHGWRFDLKDGGRELHGYRRLDVYPTKLDAGEIFVNLL